MERKNSFLNQLAKVTKIWVFLSILLGGLMSPLKMNASSLDSLNQILEKCKNKEEQFDKLIEISQNFMGTSEESFFHFANRAQTIASELSKDKSDRASINLANGYQKFGKITESNKIAEEIYDHTKDPISLIEANLLLGTHKRMQRKMDSSMMYHQQAMELTFRHDAKRYKSISVENMALHNIMRGRNVIADSLFKRALNYAIEEENNESVKRLSYSLGLTSYKAGKYDQAMSFYIKCYDKIKDSKSKDDVDQMVRVLTQLGVISTYNKDQPKAIEYWEEALKIVKENDIQSRDLFLTYGEGAYEDGLLEKAEMLASKLLEYGLLKESLIDILTGKALLGLILSKKKSVKQSNELIDEVLEEISLIDKEYGAINIYNFVVETMVHNERYDEAEILLPQYNRIESKLKSPVISAAYHRIAFIINKNLGNHKKALSEIETYHYINDSLRSALNSKVLLDAKVKFEANEKQLKNQALEEKNKVIVSNNNKMGVGLIILGILLSCLAFLFLKFRKANQLVKKQNGQLLSVNATKDRLFAIISHDLRSEVSAFQNLNNIFNFHLENKNYDRLKEIVSQVDKSAVTVNTLMDNLLQWSASQLDGITLHPEKLDLKNQTESVLSLFDQYSSTKKVDLTVLLPQNIEVYADENSLHFIIRNVISNALKYTKKGGEIIVSASESSDGIALKITDSGIGIPNEKLARIWQLDKKSSRQGTHGERGAGIGLSMVKDFVERNQGKIHIESKESVGTTVTILLPKAS